MGPRLNSWSLSPVDRYSKIRGGAEPYPDKRPHISHSQGQGDLPYYTCTKKLLGGQKGSDVNLPIGLFIRTHLS